MCVILGSPLLIYQLWAFIEPALESSEKKKTALNAMFINFFFLLGIAFGYLILVPFAVQFFAQFVIDPVITNEFDINAYFSSVAMWSFACGIIFHLPVISLFLSKMFLLDLDIMLNYRHHYLVGF